MGVKNKRKHKEIHDFSDILRGKKLPLLILDEKWLELFDLDRIPGEIKDLQNRLGKLIARQGRLNDEIAGYKRYKQQLLQEIIDNMGVSDNEVGVLKAKKIEKNQRLVNELNEKISINEESLAVLPGEIDMVNHELLITSSNIFFRKLRDGKKDIKEVEDEIGELERELVKLKIRKTDYEDGMEKMRAYMYGVYGHHVMEALNLEYEE